MSKIKLLITDGFSAQGLSVLEKSELFSITFHKGVEKPQLLELLPEQEAIIIRSATKLRGEVLEAGKNLKVIMRAGSGVDNIDVPLATNKNILVFNTPGANNNAVVELTLGYIFALLRELPRATIGMKKNLWEKKVLVGGEAQNRTLGVLGLGAIGTSVALKAQKLGMNIVGYDPKPNKNIDEIKLCSTIDEVFEKASIVTIHMPLMSSTRQSIGKNQFEKMKKGSYLINCARGDIVKEDDLLTALENETLAGAAMDVFQIEPVTNTALVSHPKFICTPHIGASTKESQEKVALSAANSLIDFFRDGSKKHALNKNEVQQE